MTAVVVAGEALIDLAPEDDGRLRPLPGGSPYNVAIGLGRLGVATRFLGAVSTDGFGQLLRQRLSAASVDLTHAVAVDAPTTLAVVHLDAAGRASYGFYLEATSAAELTWQRLPTLPDGAVLHVSFGAIGADHVPTGRTLGELIVRESGRRLVSLDPNLRPSAVGADVAAYRARLDDLVARCDLVKVSDEDLGALGLDVEATARRWARGGPTLVVVTRGPDGAVAVTADHEVSVAGRDVAVVDTVGAGDAFTSGLLAHLVDARVRDADGLAALGHQGLTAALERAVAVAAATCTRRGADPPTPDELPG